MKYIIGKNIKEPFKINNNIIILSGLNGIGKTTFFKNPISKYNIIDFSYIHKKYYKVNDKILFKTIIDNDLYLPNKNSDSIVVLNDTIHNIEKYFLNNEFKSQNMIFQRIIIPWNEWTNNGNINRQKNITNFEIIDLNMFLEKSIKSDFSNLLNKFKKAFSDYSIKNITLDIAKKDKNVLKFGEYQIIKMIRTLNKFLNKKEIIGLSDDLKHISFIDKNSEGKIPQNISSNVFSHGEKNILAIASLFLEKYNNDDFNTFYIWDEPENGLSAIWQKEILNFLKNTLEKNDYLLAITHSTHIITQAHIDKDIDLVKFERKDDIIYLNELDLNNDLELKSSLNLNSDQLKILSDHYGINTLIVEGESDKKYLKSIFEEDELNIMVAGGKSKSKELAKIIPYLMHTNKNTLVLFDNDYKEHEYKSNLESGKYSYKDDQLHFLTGLKWNNDIEVYFKKIIHNFKDNLIQHNNKEYNIIHKDNKEEYTLLINEKKINDKMYTSINKSCFFSSDKMKNNYKIIWNKDKTKEILLPSKCIMAEYILKNKLIKKDKINNWEKLKESINNYFKEVSEK